MSGNTLYLAGYSGRKPSWLLAAATRLDAVVWDIRHSPRSRRPEWSGTRLAALLGDRYQHVAGFGNLLYQTTDGCALADPIGGLAAFDAETRPIILLCVCKHSAACHRGAVASLLRQERGIVAVELDAAIAALSRHQLSLFGEAP